MKMGRRFGEKVGWPAGIGSLPQTVEVRIIRGKFVPCQGCHWRSVCVVPKGEANMSNRQGEIRNYYQCEDFIAKTAKGYENWYRAPYCIKKQNRFY